MDIEQQVGQPTKPISETLKVLQTLTIDIEKQLMIPHLEVEAKTPSRSLLIDMQNFIEDINRRLIKISQELNILK